MSRTDGTERNGGRPSDRLEVALIGGDGIGPAVVEAAALVVERAAAAAGVAVRFRRIRGGGGCYEATGRQWGEGAFEYCRDEADAVLLGAVGKPGIFLPDGEPAGRDVLFGLRLGLDLYANIRPVRTMRGVTQCVDGRRGVFWRDLDFVVVRENTEGAYVPVKGVLERGGVVELAVDERVITRRGAERLVRCAFECARLRAASRTRRSSPPERGHVCFVDKANVHAGCRLIRSVVEELSAEYAESALWSFSYVDAFCMRMVTRPAVLDVVAAPNLFGDIVSDLGAVLAGGMGMSPSANVGDEHGMFEPVHGSAPDLEDVEHANPTAAVLAAAMMFKWLAARAAGLSGARAAAWCSVPAASGLPPSLHAESAEVPPAGVAPRLWAVAEAMERAVEVGYSEGVLRPVEFGGDQGCTALAERVAETAAAMVAEKLSTNGLESG